MVTSYKTIVQFPNYWPWGHHFSNKDRQRPNKHTISHQGKANRNTRCHSIHTRIATVKTQITNVLEDVEKLEPSRTAGGTVRWCSHPLIGKQSRAFQNVKHTHTHTHTKMLNTELPFDPTFSPLDIHQEEIKTCSHKKLGHKCPSSPIHNSQRVGTTEISIIWWSDKQNVIHVCNGTSLRNKKEGCIERCYDVKKPWKY